MFEPKTLDLMENTDKPSVSYLWKESRQSQENDKEDGDKISQAILEGSALLEKELVESAKLGPRQRNNYTPHPDEDDVLDLITELYLMNEDELKAEITRYTGFYFDSLVFMEELPRLFSPIPHADPTTSQCRYRMSPTLVEEEKIQEASTESRIEGIKDYDTETIFRKKEEAEIGNSVKHIEEADEASIGRIKESETGKRIASFGEVDTEASIRIMNEAGAKTSKEDFIAISIEASAETEGDILANYFFSSSETEGFCCSPPLIPNTPCPESDKESHSPQIAGIDTL